MNPHRTRFAKKAILILSFAGYLVPVTLFALGGQEPETDPGLPVTKVVLFTTGVGYFERSGLVRDTETVDLVVGRDSVNDLMKSLVVQDLDGGSISWVSYASREPVEQSLRDLSVDLSYHPGFVEIISQLRGETVSMETWSGTTIAGAIIGVETTEQRQQVNMLDSRDRIRSVPVADIRMFRSENPEIREELERALVLAAESRYGDTRQVSLRFAGTGERRVRVGYVLGAPIWKTSYRLVLEDDQTAGDTALLQGWGIVENLSRDDWRDIELTLVSGQPISFTMDLYRPQMLSRPEIAFEVAETIRPPSYEEPETETAKSYSAAPSSRLAAPSVADLASGGFGATDEGARFDPGQGVSAAADAGGIGEFFEYRVATPVSLPRDESAMVPIVVESIPAEKISIFNRSSHPTHPFHSVRLENATDLILAGGPITVFESGGYAGDATIGLLTPGNEQLISYALDLSSRIAIDRESLADMLVSATIEAGRLSSEIRSSRTITYRVTWTHTDGRKLMIEHPSSPGWEITAAPEIDQESQSYVRLLVDPADATSFEVAESRTRSAVIDLRNATDGTIESWIDRDGVTEAVRVALRGVIDRRAGISETVRLRRAEELRRSEIVRDQARIRENLGKIESGSSLYDRYLEQLAEQEDELEAIAQRIKSLDAQQRSQREALEEYLDTLQAE